MTPTGGAAYRSGRLQRALHRLTTLAQTIWGTLPNDAPLDGRDVQALFEHYAARGEMMLTVDLLEELVRDVVIEFVHLDHISLRTMHHHHNTPLTD